MHCRETTSISPLKALRDINHGSCDVQAGYSTC